MDKEITLKALIEGGRDIKNFSQRELARRIGLSNTSLNDFLDKLEQEIIEEPSIDFENEIIDLT